MREILFRVWNTELKQYVQTDNTFINVNNGNVMEAQSIGNGYMLMIGSDKTHIVEQFTGLVDKNGTKIFEGDIYKLNDKLYEVGIDEFGTYTTKRIDILRVNEVDYFAVTYGPSGEVIGNIHEEDNNGTTNN